MILHIPPMKNSYYIQFYSLSTGYVEGTKPPEFSDSHKKPIPACGDRAVVAVDGRESPVSVATFAKTECHRRGFVGYKVYKGPNVLRWKPVSGYWPVSSGKVNHPRANSAYYGA